MRRSLLEAVIRHAEMLAEAGASDADLLRRFADSRDESAFAELLRRHGPMVWAVCRHSLVNPADAEDAFQATFLALVRSAGKVRAGAALGGWLHGVAVRVAAQAKRSAVRRRQRERKVAGPEIGRPVPEAAWNELLAAVHEEVQRLPDALRTAFVLCELEGVRQPDAAARLGWKPGTLTGRLAKARQRLLEQLTKRGLVPTVAAGAAGLGAATATAVVPASLVAKVATGAGATPGAVSPAVLELLREVTPMMLNRTKLLAAALLAAGGLGVGVGAKVISSAGAQPGAEGAPGAAPAPPVLGQPLEHRQGEGAPGAAPAPPTPRGGGARAGNDTAKPNAARGRGIGGGGFMIGSASAPKQWEYKFLGKPKSAAQFATLMIDNGDAGWELAGIADYPAGELQRAMKTHAIFGGIEPSTSAVLVFKRPRVRNRPPKAEGSAMSGMMGSPGGTSGMFGGAMGSGMMPPGMPGAVGPMMAGGMPPGMGSAAGSLPRAKSAAGEYQVIGLKHASAMDFASMLKQLFPAANVVGYSQTNSLILKADATTLREVEALIKKLDIPAPANTPGGYPGGPLPSGGAGGYLGGPGTPPGYPSGIGGSPGARGSRPSAPNSR